ncbi:hypothetical protein [Halorubrum spindle-shaped virus-BLv25]|nr:hypothetical protein [Halorubrum spindle-shaped virus-BLv25]
MAFTSEGTLVTDEREIAISETWETQTDWEAYQSISGIEITNGIIQLEESTLPIEGLLHHYDLSADSTTTSEVEDLAGSDNITGSFSGLSNTINGVQTGQFQTGDSLSGDFSDTIDQPYILFYVGEFVDNNSQQTIDDSGDNSLISRQYQNSGNPYQLNHGNNLNSGTCTEEPEIVRNVIDGGDSGVWRNGNEQVTGNAGSNSLTDIVISRDGNFEGEFGELLIYNPGASGYDTAAVESFLSDKWGITLE